MEKNETYSIAQYLIDKNKQSDSSQRTTKGTTTKKKTIYIVERVDDRPPKNHIAKILKIISILTFIGGFLVGLIFAFQQDTTLSYLLGDNETVFVWSVAIGYWAGAFVCGMIMLGFAEMIDLLQKISCQSCDYQVQKLYEDPIDAIDPEVKK